jgi:hypothetical protein
MHGFLKSLFCGSYIYTRYVSEPDVTIEGTAIFHPLSDFSAVCEETGSYSLQG